MLGVVALAAATPPPATTPATSREPPARLGRGYTLLDPSLALPPLAAMVPDLVLLPPAPVDTTPPPVAGDGGASVDWELCYSRAQLGALPNAALRDAPSTGYSRQLDTDVLTLGMAWRLAGSRVGLAYQLQSARGSRDDPGLSRFLPGSEAATHAFTLGVTREFGAGGPPPAPPPLLVPPEPTPDATPVAASPAP